MLLTITVISLEILIYLFIYSIKVWLLYFFFVIVWSGAARGQLCGERSRVIQIHVTNYYDQHQSRVQYALFY